MRLQLRVLLVFRWSVEKYIKPAWEALMLIGMNTTVPKRKRALLLHYAGPDVDEIFDTLPNTGEDNDYDTAVAKLHEYFSPQVNTTYEVYNFRQAKQK